MNPTIPGNSPTQGNYIAPGNYPTPMNPNIPERLSIINAEDEKKPSFPVSTLGDTRLALSDQEKVLVKELMLREKKYFGGAIRQLNSGQGDN
ncbi:MAG: hypothetical protein M1834_009004 [Cirrosporium novae-zelandiae]|nr:MAG: hypothetical protein M1834_009004 [Cirrosporium novae-zelandiae]